MKILLIGCGIVQIELKEALRSSQYEMDTVWMDNNLHEYPDKLRVAIQEVIDKSDNYDLILLGFGLCGKALENIKATHCDLLFPLTDDCISTFMCGNCELKKLRSSSIFTSRGWLNAENEYQNEYEMAIKKYGIKRADRIMSMMYQHYKNYIYIQTESDISDENLEEAKFRANQMHLDFAIVVGSIDIYRDLLTLNETENIGRVKKGDFITASKFLSFRVNS